MRGRAFVHHTQLAAAAPGLAPTRPFGPERGSDGPRAASTGHDFARISVRPPPPAPAGDVVQRVVIPDLGSGEPLDDTDTMTEGERLELARRFHQLHYTGGLRQLREAHPGEDFSDERLRALAAPVEPRRREKRPDFRDEDDERDLPDLPDEEEPKDVPSPRAARKPGKRAKTGPRTRERHPLSEGESESEDPDILFRSLRPDERPFESGLLPPEDHDPDKTLVQHVTSGTRAQAKSPWVSLTRSRKVAGGWASKKGRQVAKVRVTPEQRARGPVVDLTDPREVEAHASGLGSTALNSAKSSQEALARGGLPKESVLGVYNARKVSKKEYDETPEDDPRVYAKFRTRAEVSRGGKKTTPHHVVLYHTAPPPPSSSAPLTAPPSPTTPSVSPSAPGSLLPPGPGSGERPPRRRALSSRRKKRKEPPSEG